MKASKIAPNIFFQEDIYLLKNKGHIFFKSFSKNDVFAARKLLVNFNWNLKVIGQEKLIIYYSGLFRVFAIESGALYLIVKFNKNSIEKINPKSGHIFLNNDYYFLINDDICGVFNHLNDALLAESLLIKYDWDLNKLTKKIYYLLEYWVVINVENGILTFLCSSLFPKKINNFFEMTNYDEDFVPIPLDSITESKSINSISKQFNINKKNKSKSGSKSGVNGSGNVKSKSGSKSGVNGSGNVKSKSGSKSGVNGSGNVKSKSGSKSGVNGSGNVKSKSGSKSGDDSKKVKLNITSPKSPVEKSKNEFFSFDDNNVERSHYGFDNAVKLKSNYLKRVDKYIYKKDDKFVVVRSNVLFGSSYFEDGARLIRSLFDNFNWDLRKLDSLENIIYKNNYYWVVDFSRNYIDCIDFFKDYDEAFECFNNRGTTNITNSIPSKHYGDSFITKVDNQFYLYVNLNNKDILFGIFNFQKHAEVAELILSNNKWDLDKIIRKNGIFYEFNTYWLLNVIDDMVNVIGNFDTYDEAFDFYKGINYDVSDIYSLFSNVDMSDNSYMELHERNQERYWKNYFEETNYSKSKKQFQVNQNSYKSKSSKPGSYFRKINDYVYQLNDGTYHIFNMVNGEFLHFGEFDSLSDVNDALSLLMHNNWNIDKN